MSRKPGQPSKYLQQIYDQLLIEQRALPGGGERHPEVLAERQAAGEAVRRAGGEPTEVLRGVEGGAEFFAGFLATRVRRDLGELPGAIGVACLDRPARGPVGRQDARGEGEVREVVVELSAIADVAARA